MTTQIIRVPGFWLGGWARDEVAPLLHDCGFDVVALTLPGIEGSGGADVGLARQAAVGQ